MTVNISKPVINVREKLAELDKPSGLAGEAMLRADTISDQASLLGYPQRNVIINGDMQIAQRGTSLTGRSNDSFTLDRWLIAESGSAVFTSNQSSEAPPGFAHSLHLDVTTADSSVSSGDYVFLRHKIEGNQLGQFATGTTSAKAHTLSFWIRSSVTGTYIVELEYDSSNRNSQSYTINSADTWEHKVLVFPANSSVTPTYDNTEGLQARFWLMSGTNYSGGSTLNSTGWAAGGSGRAVGQVNAVDDTANNIYLTGVQLIPGSYPEGVPFIHRSYGEELDLCQRYFFIIDGMAAGKRVGTGFASSSTTAQCLVTFPVTMRSDPTGAVSGPAGWSFLAASGTAVASAITLSSTKFTSYVNLTISGATAGEGGLLRATSGGSTLSFEAEL